MNFNENYGFYRVLGNLIVIMEDIFEVIGYKRVFDFKIGVYILMFSFQGEDFEIKVFCFYFDSVCVYEIFFSGKIFEFVVSFENQLVVLDLVNVICEENVIFLNGII